MNDITSNLIVKVQIPLSSTEKTPQALYYNRDRSITGFLPVTKKLEQTIQGKYKGFFFARKDKDSEIVLLGAAPWQDW